MTLIYRSLWSDEVPSGGGVEGYVEQAGRRFAAWARREGQDRRPPSEVALEADDTPAPDGRTSLGDREVTLFRLDEGNGFEGVTVDHADDGNVWTTRVRLRAQERRVHVVVDNSVEGDDPTAKIAVGRPVVVDLLLDLAAAPRLGSGVVQADVLPVSAEAVPALVEHLRDPARQLPVVVFTDRADTGRPTVRDLAAQVARRSAGVAVVATLDGAAVTAFREQLNDLAVWGGAVRTYMPAPMAGPRDAWRHRFVTVDRFRERPAAAVDRLVAATAALSTRRAVPEVMSVFDTVAGDAEERNAVLRVEKQILEEQVLAAAIDAGDIAEQLTRSMSHLDRLRSSLTDHGMADLFWGTKSTQDLDLPDDVETVTMAFLVAQESLSLWLALPDEALQQVERLDTAPSSRAWGNNVYRGLRALAAYAEQRAAGEPGDFWRWCESSRHPLVWPATTKKLAMSESETVTSNPKFMRARMLPVDVAVDLSGKTTMVCHLKIAEGGGDLAPRVYFLDDTGGPTAKVHVGLVGPHYLVPNSRS